ncbi:BID domain-containing protein [Ensifer aridi]|uniref:BID domain-containing protein n=1 Tax=Ensifer aridi TaxID=1708715 RepID=UPI0015E3C712|nr:BID domain-containing protein [Ensifer aridi]
MQREFFAALAERAGHPLEFGVISEERMTFVSAVAHESGDLAPMCRMFAEITDPDRVNALEVAQQAIERFRPAQAPHVTAWDGSYMATTEPGQDYSGRFSGAAGPNFMMQRDDGAIIIGNVVDLPDPRPATGAHFSFIASNPRAVELAQEQANAPLIAAVREWPTSVEAAVAARLATRPSIEAATRRLEAAVAAVWQDPQAVMAEICRRNEVEQRPVSDFAHDIRQNPEALGSLNGSRSLFGREDVAREKALAAVPLAVAALHDYGQVRGSLIADLTRDEERFRALMREPVNDLSPAARELVARIERAPAHDLGALVRTANHEPALAELRGFIATVRERFGVPGSLVLDQDRLAQAITNGTPERLEAFTTGLSRAQSIVSRVEAFQQANNLQMCHDQQHSHDKGKTFEL